MFSRGGVRSDVPPEALPDRLLNSVCVAAVAIGVYAPWLTVNPALPADTAVPASSFTGMGAGVEVFDVVVFGVVGLGLFLRWLSTQKSAEAAVTLSTGLGIAGFCLLYLATAPRIGFTGTFVPAAGWYLTMSTGLLLTLTGGTELLSADITHRVQSVKN